MSCRRPWMVLLAAAVLAVVWLGVDRVLGAGDRIRFLADDVTAVHFGELELETNRWHRWADLGAWSEDLRLEGPVDPRGVTLRLGAWRATYVDRDGHDGDLLVVEGEPGEAGDSTELRVVAGPRTGTVRRLMDRPRMLVVVGPERTPWRAVVPEVQAWCETWYKTREEGEEPLVRIHGAAWRFNVCDWCISNENPEDFGAFVVDLDETADLTEALARVRGGMPRLTLGDDLTVADLVDLLAALERLDVPYVLESKGLDPGGRRVRLEPHGTSDMHAEVEEEPLEHETPELGLDLVPSPNEDL